MEKQEAIKDTGGTMFMSLFSCSIFFLCLMGLYALDFPGWLFFIGLGIIALATWYFAFWGGVVELLQIWEWAFGLRGKYSYRGWSDSSFQKRIAIPSVVISIIIFYFAFPAMCHWAEIAGKKAFDDAPSVRLFLRDTVAFLKAVGIGLAGLSIGEAFWGLVKILGVLLLLIVLCTPPFLVGLYFDRKSVEEAIILRQHHDWPPILVGFLICAGIAGVTGWGVVEICDLFGYVVHPRGPREGVFVLIVLASYGVGVMCSALVYKLLEVEQRWRVLQAPYKTRPYFLLPFIPNVVKRIFIDDSQNLHVEKWGREVEFIPKIEEHSIKSSRGIFRWPINYLAGASNFTISGSSGTHHLRNILREEDFRQAFHSALRGEAPAAQSQTPVAPSDGGTPTSNTAETPQPQTEVFDKPNRELYATARSQEHSDQLEEAYNDLGLSFDAPREEVERAYLRVINRVPEDMVERINRSRDRILEHINSNRDRVAQ